MPSAARLLPHLAERQAQIFASIVTGSARSRPSMSL